MLFCSFRDILVGLDIDFWLLYSFGLENRICAVILTTQKNQLIGPKKSSPVSGNWPGEKFVITFLAA